MNKIPLEATLVGAYRFLFTNIVSIIGIIWFPTVLVLGLIAGLLCLIVPHEWWAGDFSQLKDQHVAVGMIGKFVLAYSVVALAGIIAGSMILVGLMRQALGLKKTTTFIYFSLGAPVWRMIGAMLLGGIIFAVCICVIAVAGGLAAAFIGPMLPHGAVVAGRAILLIVFYLFIFYAAFRLFFFLPAVVVAEERIGLGRSWELGGGNFWRMFLVYLLIVIPAGFVFAVALDVTILSGLMEIVTEAKKMPDHPAPKDVLVLLHSLLPLLPVVVGIAIVYGIAVRGLMIGAIANAYNAVAGTAAKE